ncbi:hypothetical protein [Candidatus Binatus sp.]|uniref:hypothetical protein n=1 Tax=Candidatus Binatus sp. TaxID=2811406 RepID=UPI003BB0804C
MTSSLEARSQNPAHFDSQRSLSVHGFETDFVVPVQFYDLIRRSAFLDGETRLVFAVLEDAVRTYVRLRDSCRRRDRVEFTEVARWFEARTGVVPFSFEYVCEVLELEPGSFRKQLRIVQPHVLPMKQLRSVGRHQRVRSTRYAEKRSSWEA